RRNLMLAVSGTAAVSLAPRLTLAQAGSQAGPQSGSQAPTSAGPFSLDPLPYPANALEPYIDAHTMELHHGRHHAAYVNNLNMIAKDYPQIGRVPPGDLLEKLTELPETVRTGVRNNLGGHVNHTMFWTIMKTGGGKPSGDLAAAVNRDLGGMEKLTND